MTKMQIFSSAVIAAIIFLAISVYYIIPGYAHLFVTHDPTQSHYTHAFAFFVLAAIAGFLALVNRPKVAK